MTINWKKLGLAAGAVVVAGSGLAYCWPSRSSPSNGHKIDVYSLRGKDLYAMADSVDTERGKDIVVGRHMQGTDMLSVYVARWDDMDKIKERYKLTEGRNLPEFMDDLQREGLVTRVVLKAPLTQEEYLKAAGNLANRQDFPVLRLNDKRLGEVRFNYRQTGRNPVAIGIDDVDNDGLNEIVIDVDDGLYAVRKDTWKTNDFSPRSFAVEPGQYPALIPETDAEVLSRNNRTKMLQTADQEFERFAEGAKSDTNEAGKWVRDEAWRFADRAIELFEEKAAGDVEAASQSSVERMRKDFQDAEDVFGE